MIFRLKELCCDTENNSLDPLDWTYQCKMNFVAIVTPMPIKTLKINVCFRESAHLPLTKRNINTYFSLLA